MPNIGSLHTDNVVQTLNKIIQFSLYTFAVFSIFSISVTQIAFTIGTLAWLLKIHLTKSWKETKGTQVGIAILFFCLACLLAVITSVDIESSYTQLKKLLQFAIFFWAINTVQDERERNLLVKLLIIAGTVATLNGFSQVWDTAVTIDSRVRGTMSHFMTFAGVLMLVSLMALSRFLFHKPKEYWLLGSIGFMCSCLLFTLTRQAWLGFFVGSIFLFFFWNKKYLLLIPFLLISLLLFGPEAIKDRMYSLTDMTDWTFQARIFLWEGGWTIFRDHPLTGCGFKCVDLIHSQYPDPSGYIARFRGMHSNLFQLLVDTGILGLSAWLSIWATYLTAIYKKSIQSTNENSKGFTMGAVAAVLGFLAGGIFETNFYDSEIVMLLYFIMGISLAQIKQKSMQ